MDKNFTVTVNTANIVTLREALEYIGSEMNFPSYYRPNRDALNDCLSEIFDEVTIRILIDGEGYSEHAEVGSTDGCEETDWTKQLIEVLENVSQQRTNISVDVIRTGYYRHYKGNNYKVIGFARNSETLEYMVIYKALYGEGGIWARPADMWNEIVTVNGEEVPRFSRTV